MLFFNFLGKHVSHPPSFSSLPWALYYVGGSRRRVHPLRNCNHVGSSDKRNADVVCHHRRCNDDVTRWKINRGASVFYILFLFPFTHLFSLFLPGAPLVVIVREIIFGRRAAMVNYFIATCKNVLYTCASFNLVFSVDRYAKERLNLGQI